MLSMWSKLIVIGFCVDGSEIIFDVTALHLSCRSLISKQELSHRTGSITPDQT